MMARLVRDVGGFHPRSIAIDIAFLNPRDADVDAELAAALKAVPAVVAAIGNFDAVRFLERNCRTERSGFGAEALLRALADRLDPRCGASRTSQCFDRYERGASLHSDDL